MLDMYVSNVLSLKRFHGAETGDTHECLLKLSIGRVRVFRQSQQRLAADCLQRPLRARFRQQVSASVRVSAGKSRQSVEGCKSLTVKG